MEKKDKHLPVYGVGPYYGAIVIITTIISFILSFTNVLESGRINVTWLKILFIIIGILTLIIGLYLWIPTAFGKKSIDNFVKKNELCVTGRYALCRNPCYSGIMFIATGILLIGSNLWLLILPLIYYIGLTILLINSEEKWLLKLYGESYQKYLKNTNRIIPNFFKKTKNVK